MTAKERHKQRSLAYLGDPENDYPPRQVYAEVLKIAIPTLYKHFSPSDLQDIENEAYEIRKKNSTKQRAAILLAMLAEAKSGNVSAANLFLDRTEGKVPDKVDANISGYLDILVQREGVE